MAVGEGQGLVSGYQGRGAATILAGGEQEPLAVLQRKKMLGQREKDKQLASSQAATGQLTGAWDRDIPSLAEKRGAYVKLNSHFMQQNIDPRDPSNADAYSTNRDVYSRLQDKFKASAQHKLIYDKSQQMIAGDKANKYDREASITALEQWSALPLEERMNSPMPTPILRPEKFNISDLIADSAEAIKTQTTQQKPFIDPTTGALMFPNKTEPQEGWENFAKTVYMDNYEKIIKKDPSLDGEKGFAKFLGKYKSLLKTEDKVQIRQKAQIPAWQRKGQGKKEAFMEMQDRIAKAQVGDTRVLQEMVGLRYAGNVIKEVGFNTRTGTVEVMTEDDSGNLFPMKIDVNNPESFGQFLNIYTGGNMSEEDMVEFKKIPQHSGYEYDDISAVIDTKVDALIAGSDGSAPFTELKGKQFNLTRDGISYNGVIDEVKTNWKIRGDNEIVFKLTNGTEIPIKVSDKGVFWDIYENSGLVRRQALKRKGAATQKKEGEPTTTGKPKIDW